jgi:putative transposase
MVGIGRAVAAGLPCQLTQGGNRRQETFFCDDDCRAYIQLMGEWRTKCGAEVRGYCLMPNHVHLFLVPESEESLVWGRRRIENCVGTRGQGGLRVLSALY